MTEIFDRQEEMQRLRQRIESRKSTLLYGPAGVGKTLLLSRLAPSYRQVLYCSNTTSQQAAIRRLAEQLAARHDATVMHLCKGRSEDLISKSFVTQKGVVLEALRAGKYNVILDHLHRPSGAFAGTVREIMVSCSTPIVAVARSEHMEDAGFVSAMLPDRQERLAMKNFDPETAQQFACIVCAREGLEAENLLSFLEKVVSFSEGNPASIIRLMSMARQSKYRSGNHVKWSPLYIDFRLELISFGTN